MFLAFTALAQNLLSTFARSCVAATSLGWSTKDLVGQSQLWPALHQRGKFQLVSTALLGKIGLLNQLLGTVLQDLTPLQTVRMFPPGTTATKQKNLGE